MTHPLRRALVLRARLMHAVARGHLTERACIDWFARLLVRSEFPGVVLTDVQDDGDGPVLLVACTDRDRYRRTHGALCVFLEHEGVSQVTIEGEGYDAPHYRLPEGATIRRLR